jgi:hypothetical protein
MKLYILRKINELPTMKRILLFFLAATPVLKSYSDDPTYIPVDCQSYYMCIDGECYLQTCPPSLFFDPTRNVCDFPENTPCGSGGGGTPVTKSFTLINPPNFDIDMVIAGGQQLDGKATNNNILGVTLTIKSEFTSSTTLYSGILLPGFSHTYSDYIFGTIPLTYRHSASTSSDAANVVFLYTTTM